MDHETRIAGFGNAMDYILVVCVLQKISRILGENHSSQAGIRSTHVSGCIWESKNQVLWMHITITNFEYKFLYRHIVGICIIQTYRYLLRFEIKAISIKQGTGNRENWRTFRHLVTEDVLLKNSIIYMYRYIIYKYAPPQKSFPP